MEGPGSKHAQLDRLPLLQKIVDITGLARVSVDAWALLWTCDVQKLGDVVSQLDQRSSNMFLQLVIEMPNFVWFHITKPCKFSTPTL
jgi:hypothetical protein